MPFIIYNISQLLIHCLLPLEEVLDNVDYILLSENVLYCILRKAVLLMGLREGICFLVDSFLKELGLFVIHGCR